MAGSSGNASYVITRLNYKMKTEKCKGQNSRLPTLHQIDPYSHADHSYQQ